MKLKAIIEIPKGNDRRWHLNYDKSAIEDFGLIKERIPVNDGVMPVAYGYLEDTENEAEKDNVDILVFSSKDFKIGEGVEVVPFGYIIRDDGDHKVFAVDGTMDYKSWSDIPKEEADLILKYFGYNHKIISIENADSAEEYITNTII